MPAIPRCSVIVPTYDRAPLLRLTLDALARQTLPPEEFEVVVTDDGSSDGTDAVVAGYAGRLQLRYLYQEDRGFRVARARNAALRLARGPVSVFLDAGMLPTSGTLAAHCRLHETASGPVAAVGYAWGFRDDAADVAADLADEQAGALDPNDPDATVRRLAPEDRFRDVREWYYARYGEDLDRLAAPWLVYWTCNASASTAQLHDVGLFDEAFTSWGGEDVDLAYRLHRDGARFALCREAAAVHWPHPKADTRGVRANHRYFAEKYATPVTRLRPDHDIFLIEQVIRDRGLAPTGRGRAPVPAAPVPAAPAGGEDR